MNENANPKEKILDRIKRENIKHEENFNQSLTNQYTYSIKTIINGDKSEKQYYITAPKFTDDSILEQAYFLAHELGYHIFNKRLSPIALKLSSLNNINIRYIIEKKAWKEARFICIEESIPTDQEFFSVRNKCLKTCKNAIKHNIKRKIIFLLKMFKLYFEILLCLYLVYKGVNDNVIDLFGILKLFKGITVQFVYSATNAIWVSYIAGYILNVTYKSIFSKE